MPNSHPDTTEAAAANTLEGLNGHADVIENLQQEVQQHREALAQLSADAGRQSTADTRSDAILLRIGELERKIGESTSDPIIDEIASRLGDIEQRVRNKESDPRIAELTKEISGLKQSINKVSTARAPNDDSVLRIAALEGRLVRADELEERLSNMDAALAERKELIDGVNSRVEQLESKPASDALEIRLAKAETNVSHLTTLSEAAAKRGDLDPLGERLTPLETAGNQPVRDERVDALQSQVNDFTEYREALEVRFSAVLKKSSGDTRVDGLQSRLSELEEHRAAQEAKAGEEDPRISSLEDRLQSVEERPVPKTPSIDVEALQTKVDGLQTSVEAAKSDETVSRLKTRLDQLETEAKELATKTSDIDVWRDPVASLTSRIYDLEQKPAQLPEDVQSRLAAIETKPEPAVDDSKIDDLSSRLKSLEERPDTPAEASVPAAVEERIAQLEEQATASAGQETADLSGLETRLQALETAPAPAAPEGLTQIESRLEKLETAPAVEVDQSRLDALESRLLEKVSASPGGTDVSALLDRVTTLESWSSTSAPEIDDDTIARITERVKAGAGPERLVEVLDRLDQVEARLVAGADGNSHVEIDARLAGLGHTVIDLGLPERNSFLDTMVLATKIIGWLGPDLIVSHEEFGALPASKVHDTTAVFVTDWFVESSRISMQSLRFADSIIFIDEAGFFEEPALVAGHVNYVGPIMRKFEYSRADRQRAREELALPPDAAVISVLPGSYANEERVPIADLVLEAFDQLTTTSKRLVWVAGADEEILREKVGSREDILIRGYDWRIDRVMSASDAAITKSNRKTVLELESLGIPSIAISPGTNPIDDARTSACEGVIFRRLEQLDAQALTTDLTTLLDRDGTVPKSPSPSPGARGAAEIISELIDAATSADADSAND